MDNTITMPTQHDTGGTDILDDLLDLVRSNGAMDDSTRHRIMAEALIELVRRTRKLERESVVGLFRANPVKVAFVGGAIFILLHELATYINISVFLTAAARLLGIPVPGG